MAILNQKRILNLIPKTSAPVTIHVSQGDVGTEIEFTLVKGDELFVNTGSLSASVHGVREDGANFGVFTCTLSGSSVKFPLHAEMTAVKGSAIAEIVLVDSQGNKVGSSNFGIMVEESVFPLGVTYDNDVSVYESILAYVQTIPAQVEADFNAAITQEAQTRAAADSAFNTALLSEITALANEESARKAADNVLDARIDQIVAPSGEAPSAAEVADARIGADGVTYASLGAATRTQFNDVVDSINNSTGNERIIYLDKTYISTVSPLTFTEGHPDQNPGSSAYSSAYVACNAGDKFTVSGDSNNSNIRVWAFVNSSGVVLSAAASSIDVDNILLVAPTNAAWLVLNTKTFTDNSYKGELITERVNNIEDFDDLTNGRISSILNSVTSRIGKIPTSEYDFVSNLNFNENQIVTESDSRCLVIPIAPKSGINITKLQTVVCKIGFTSDYPAPGVAITSGYHAYGGVDNTDITAMSQATDNYCIFIYYLERLETQTASAIEASIKVNFASTENEDVNFLIHCNDSMINLLKYRPLGKNEKPYIAFSCDDGHATLATITLPRIKYWADYYSKNVPLHMALFDTSPVLLDADYLALVKEMCEDYGCSIGIHGPTPFTSYTPSYLYDFLKKQEGIIYSTTGIMPTSVIYPHAAYDDERMTIAGSMYNVCGSGAGREAKTTYPDGQGRLLYNGEKTNCYEIFRLSIRDERIDGDSDVEYIIDYAYDHNYILCPFFHDDDLEAATTVARLDKFITYAMEKGMNFINFGDIPYVV